MTNVSRARGDRERGASLVEFALILPLFMMLVLGMFSGGQAYNTKLGITAAAREGSRYGSTQPLSTTGPCGPTRAVWLSCVADATRQAGTGDLTSTSDGAAICVAFIDANTSGTADLTPISRRESPPGTVDSSWPTSSPCFSDALTGQKRVQVVAQRTSRLEYLVSSNSLTLVGRSVTKSEA